MGDDGDLTEAQVSDCLKHFRAIVTTKIRSVGIERGYVEYDDLYSDGRMALWRALVEFDQTRGPLEAYLCNRVGWAITDGMRSRGRTRAQVRPRILSLELVSAEGRLVDPMDLESLIADRDLIARLAACDPRLAVALEAMAGGATAKEAAAAAGVTRPTIWRALQAAKARVL